MLEVQEGRPEEVDWQRFLRELEAATLLVRVDLSSVLDHHHSLSSLSPILAQSLPILNLTSALWVVAKDDPW